ncbi:hypothetical protein L195_g001696 [Trifolium pratense]|uniref:Uncharacterized protein n=1 Tax=Trifolium pratense TaxID=57577 RepID=A0A2K3NQE3_TRIPR|nr:hypothetical protein L195_g001696 [Trifolium pratense]
MCRISPVVNAARAYQVLNKPPFGRPATPTNPFGKPPFGSPACPAAPTMRIWMLEALVVNAKEGARC